MAPSTVTANGKTFLIIDSDQKSIALMRRFLSAEGARRVYVEEATRGAIDILSAGAPPVDCVICAEDVAPLTGIELLKGIRSGRYGDAPYTRGVSFVMVTAHRERELVEACKVLAVDGYIVKPLDLNSFGRHLLAALAHKKELASAHEYLAVDIAKAVHLPVVLRQKWAETLVGPNQEKA